MYKPNPPPSLPRLVLLQVPYLSEWHHQPSSYASQTPGVRPTQPAHPPTTEPNKFTSHTRPCLPHVPPPPGATSMAHCPHTRRPASCGLPHCSCGDLAQGGPGLATPSAASPRVKPQIWLRRPTRKALPDWPPLSSLSAPAFSRNPELTLFPRPRRLCRGRPWPGPVLAASTST